MPRHRPACRPTLPAAAQPARLQHPGPPTWNVQLLRQLKRHLHLLPIDVHLGLWDAAGRAGAARAALGSEFGAGRGAEHVGGSGGPQVDEDSYECQGS